MDLSNKQRQAVREYSAAVSLFAFLAQQPALYKLAARVVKRWMVKELQGIPLYWWVTLLQCLVRNCDLLRSPLRAADMLWHDT